MSNNKNLEVSLLTPDQAEQYMLIRHTAFRHDINKILYANAPQYNPSPSTLSAVTSSIQDGILNKGIIFTKCVETPPPTTATISSSSSSETSPPTIIAGARWTHYKPSPPSQPCTSPSPLPQTNLRTPADLDKDYTIPDPYPESNTAMWNEFFDLFHSVKRDVMGLRPFFKLDTLVTHPDHHRKGAGKALLEEGLRRVDEEGLECYLESSVMGRPLYERFGFVAVREISLDLTRWGGDEEICWTIMRRPAKKCTE
ncbi:unnamed protein product [Periconia digitata]|uniref:N-acetyltransferase domain-containing protein n=1 Tax=Periconia digitata TaxID=1303443 RepID=A0A9W4XW67_9PLEO|nr:unnamed protein product [Periconia digitata]